MVTSYVQLLARRYKSQLDADAEVETTKMTDSLPLIHTGEDHVGWMRAEVWQGTHDILLEQGLLDEPVDLAEVYTMGFLQKVLVLQRDFVILRSEATKNPVFQ